MTGTKLSGLGWLVAVFRSSFCYGELAAFDYRSVRVPVRLATLSSHFSAGQPDRLASDEHKDVQSASLS